jgi:hypothetical protein
VDKIMSLYRESCKGCIFHEYASCLLINLRESKRCPCRICIIKGICSQHCKERKEIYLKAVRWNETLEEASNYLRRNQV